MLYTVADVIKFQHELGHDLTKYIDLVNNGTIHGEGIVRRISQLIAYYNRMKGLHENTMSSDDEEDVDTGNPSGATNDLIQNPIRLRTVTFGSNTAIGTLEASEDDITDISDDEDRDESDTDSAISNAANDLSNFNCSDSDDDTDSYFNPSISNHRITETSEERETNHLNRCLNRQILGIEPVSNTDSIYDNLYGSEDYICDDIDTATMMGFFTRPTSFSYHGVDVDPSSIQFTDDFDVDTLDSDTFDSLDSTDSSVDQIIYKGSLASDSDAKNDAFKSTLYDTSDDFLAHNTKKVFKKVIPELDGHSEQMFDVADTDIDYNFDTFNS